MQEMSHVAVRPEWLIIIVFALAFVGLVVLFGQIFRPRAGIPAPVPPPRPVRTDHTHLLFSLGVLAFALLLFGWLMVGVTSVRREFQVATQVKDQQAADIEFQQIGQPRPPRTESPLPAPVGPNAPEVELKRLTDSPNAPMPPAPPATSVPAVAPVTVKRDASRSAIEDFFRSFHGIALGPSELIILLIVGALIFSRYRPADQQPPASVPPITERKLSYPWLVVPVACLGGLGYLAQPAFHPAPRPDVTSQDQSFEVRQQKMAKVLRELIDTAGTNGNEIQSVPDWLKSLELPSGQYLLTSEQFSTRKEAEDDLLPQAAYLLQRAFHELHPWQGAWEVPLAQVRERVVQQQFVERRTKSIGKFSGDIYRLHMLVNVEPKVADTFVDEWKSQVVRQRLEVLGVLLAWLTSVMITGSFYFRRGTHPENKFGWAQHLQMSGIIIALTGAAAWVLTNSLHVSHFGRLS